MFYSFSAYLFDTMLVDNTMAADDTDVVAPTPATEPASLVLVTGGNPDPLHNLNNIRQAVADLSKETPDSAPMVEMFNTMAQELRSLSLAQKITKKENSLLLAASGKAKVGEVLSRLTNPMSQRAVTLNFRVLHILEDIMTVLKPNGVVYVSADLVQVGAVILAQTVLLEEITRIIQRDSEVHQIAKDSHIGHFWTKRRRHMRKGTPPR